MAQIGPRWTNGFVFDLALEFDPPEVVCARHGVSAEEYMRLMGDKMFLDTMQSVHRQQRVEGKFGQVLAGAVLDDTSVRVLKEIIDDPDTSPETKIKALEELRIMSGRGKLEGPVAPAFSLTMHFDRPALPVGEAAGMDAVVPKFEMPDE